MELKEIKTIKLEKGEILVVRCKDEINKATYQYLKRAAIEILKDAGYDNEVMILDGNIELEKISKG
jgi:pyruvate kinase